MILGGPIILKGIVSTRVTAPQKNRAPPLFWQPSRKMQNYYPPPLTESFKLSALPQKKEKPLYTFLKYLDTESKLTKPLVGEFAYNCTGSKPNYSLAYGVSVQHLILNININLLLVSKNASTERKKCL